LCECYVLQVTGKICAHQAYAAPRFGVTLDSLVGEQDTLQRWQAQYSEAVGDYEVPGTAMLDRFEKDELLLVPVAAPIKPGRPSEKVTLPSSTHAPRKRTVRARRVLRPAPTLTPMPASTPITSYPCLRAFVKRKAGVLQKVQDKSKGGDKKKKGGKAVAAAVAKASKTRAAPPYTVHNPE
jgi:hypothetical protein